VEKRKTIVMTNRHIEKTTTWIVPIKSASGAVVRVNAAPAGLWERQGCGQRGKNPDSHALVGVSRGALREPVPPVPHCFFAADLLPSLH
jgi:hypothetical protein